jgi:hypothetical protein
MFVSSELNEPNSRGVGVTLLREMPWTVKLTMEVLLYHEAVSLICFLTLLLSTTRVVCFGNKTNIFFSFPILYRNLKGKVK